MTDSNPRRRFPRSARVRSRAEYAVVFNDSRRCSEPLMSLHWRPQEGPARLGMAVSRKVDKRAVGRNRIKRILRDSFRHLLPQLAGGDCVVVARSAAARASNEELRIAFERILRRAGALPASSGGVTMPPRPEAHASSPPLTEPEPRSD
ncbi:MAG TPA: ribonuclease P protein component [Stenotrophomonas sp.]|nr:ribonuclease P protein component [Stenotrophomonas sp.]